MTSEACQATTPVKEETKETVEGVVPQLPSLEASSRVITPAMRRKEWIQFSALCSAVFVCGWNDGTIGPLIPRLQEVYHVGYAVVSMIFICSCVGFVSGASSYLYLTDRFGFGPMVVFASCMLAVGNALQASGPPFPAFVIAFLFSGFGESFLSAGSNAFLASLTSDNSVKMGIMHAIYGTGAMCAPLVSTQFASLPRWSFVYLVHLGLICLNALHQVVVFKFRDQHACLAEIGELPPEKTKASEEGVNKYKQVFRLRATHVMAFFALTYVGVEVTVGGWIVTYIIDERHGGPNSGYISSGFFGGLTVGRIALLWFNRRIGEWRVIFVYLLLVLGLEIAVWQVDYLLPSAICVSFVGFFLGPIYPIMMNHAGNIFPAELISGGIGWIASFGAAGAAAFPFIAGAVASGAGIGTLQPILISMIGLMFLLWVFVPSSRDRLK